MNTLSYISSIYYYSVWIIIVIILGLLIYRIYKLYFHGSTRYKITSVKGEFFPKILKGLFGIGMFLILISSPFIVYLGSAFKILIPGYLNHLLFISMISLAGFEVWQSFSISQKLLEKTYKKVALTILVVLIIPVFGDFAWQIPKMLSFPSMKESHIIKLPVKEGTWFAGHAGATEITNYHNAYTSQKYAIDIEKVNQNGEFYKGKGDTITDVYTMNEKVYAPVTGTITKVEDSLPNLKITFSPNNKKNPAGNHVIIRFQEDRYLFMAHLNKGAIQVDSGDNVKAGDYIGKLGNSGNTSWPHLHMHIQNRSKLKDTTATGYPFRFEKMERKRWLSWKVIENGYLIRNDLFRAVE